MASVGVVEALDVLEQGKSGFGLCGKRPAICQFAFQAGEEALAQGVVVAVADRPHVGSDTSLFAPLAEGYGGVLRSLVAVVDNPFGSALAKDHVQGVFDQFVSQMVGHGP